MAKTWNSVLGLAPLVILTAVACGKKSGSGAVTAETMDNPANAAMAIINTVGGASTEVEGVSAPREDPTAVTQELLVGSDLDENVVAGAPRCKLAELRGACNGGSSLQRFSKCASAATSTLEGQWKAQYVPEKSCELHVKTGQLDDAAQIIKTTARLVVHGESSDMNISSDAHTTVNGKGVGGGVQISRIADAGEMTTKIHILGLHKTDVPRGNSKATGYQYSIRSDDSTITVRGSKPKKNRIAAGIATVDDNGSKGTIYSVTLNNVEWSDPNCCYPTAGTASIVMATSQNRQIRSQLLFGAGKSCGVATFVNDGTGGKRTDFPLSLCEE